MLVSGFMDIPAYLKKHGLTQEAFGKQVGVSQSMVWQWISGMRRVSAEMAVQVEKRTTGAIGRHELRSDIFEKPKRAA